MSGLTYVGKAPAEATDVETKISTEDLLNTGISRSYVTDRVNTLVSPKATKVYVDTKDNQFADVTYPTTQDALLVPNSAKGASGGVASLDNGSPPKIPSAQVPILGAGVLRGPYGPSSFSVGTTGLTPLKIAEWVINPLSWTSQLLAYANLSAQSVAGRTVIEIRAGTSAQTTYAAQTLISQGFGRSAFNDYQVINVIPVTALDNEGQDGVQDSWSPSTNLLVNMWMYDDGGGQSTITTGLVVTAPLFVMRVAQ